MIKIRHSGTSPVILILDGEVHESFFDRGDSRRDHIIVIKTIQVGTEKKGKHSLHSSLKHDSLYFDLDEAAMPKIKELIAQMEKTKASSGAWLGTRSQHDRNRAQPPMMAAPLIA